MIQDVTNECALSAPKMKLVLVIGSEIWIASKTFSDELTGLVLN